MPAPLTKRITLGDLRAARATGQKWPMLTCYDYTTARHMEAAGVPMLLVGDSAASVILGHDTTLPVPLSFMIQVTAAVRRGAPHALVVGDMPFGSYQASRGQAVRNVCRMVQRGGCDAVKLEVGPTHAGTVAALADAGVAVIAHIGLKPQWVGLLGGYKFQGRTADEADAILALALQMQSAGAAALLLEAVVPEVANAVVQQTAVPVIGCGAGSACHACVIVTQDAVGLTPHRPKFVPDLGDLAVPMKEYYQKYVREVTSGRYPSAEHDYTMPPAEKAEFLKRQGLR